MNDFGAANSIEFTNHKMHRIGSIAAALIDGNQAPLDALFDEATLPAPTIEWIDPIDPVRIPNCHIKLFDYWNRKRSDKVLPARSQTDPLEMVDCLGDVHLIAAQSDHFDFKYLVSATNACQRAGIEMTGRAISNTPAPSQLKVYVAALYRAVLFRKKPLYSRHISNLGSRWSEWDRLLLPLGTECSEADFCLVSIFGHDAKRHLAR